jgi:hypothetical protein
MAQTMAHVVSDDVCVSQFPEIGLFCASFFHFFVHDQTGPIGIALRDAVHSIPGVQMGLDDRTFCVTIISIFMQAMYILQLPELLGPSFSPFSMIQYVVGRGLVFATRPTMPRPAKVETVTASSGMAKPNAGEAVATDDTKTKKKKSKGKKKVQ